MLQLSQYTTESFLPAVERLLVDKAASLEVPAEDILALMSGEQVTNFVETKHPNEPLYLDYLASVIPLALSGGSTLSLAKAAFTYNRNRFKYDKKRRPIEQLVTAFTLVRPILTLTDKEKALTRGVAALVATGKYGSKEWYPFLARLTWGEGKCSLRPDPALQAHPRMRDAAQFLRELIRHAFPEPHESFLADTAAAIADTSRDPAINMSIIDKALSDGARWMSDEDLAQSPYYTTSTSNSALLLGETESGLPVYYEGNESLITFGGPGTGKSQGQVITNLLTCPGSAIVLDVKGELWEATAGYRQAKYGPVYRFAPTDPSGRSHRFNPFDFISTNPDIAANDCEVFSYQIIATNPHLKEPYFENKGRDFLWAFAMALTLRADPKFRNMAGLAELMALRTDYKRNTPEYEDSMTCKLIASLVTLSKDTGIPDLEQAANAFSAGLGGQRLESVMDAARRYLSSFSRSAYVRNAMSRSDWRPNDLRRKPGTTVYICIAELKEFAPIIRLLVYQHFRILRAHQARQGEPPITFFLDEMPQLGNFESILQMQDVGRGSGLRLWMFAQHPSQLKDAYGERATGIIDTCRARCFMQPDSETAKLIAPALGEVRNVFTGEKQPLAAPYELSGRAYGDKTIVTTRGDHPMALKKRMAFRHYANLIRRPPAVP